MEPTTGFDLGGGAPPRIPRYRVLRHGRGLVAVRADWCWAGFLLPWAWPLVLRLWGPGLALSACLAAAYATYLADGRAGSLYLMLGVDGTARVAAGLWTHGLRLRRLRRTGWTEVAQVRAISAEDALDTVRIRHPEFD